MCKSNQINQEGTWSLSQAPSAPHPGQALLEAAEILNFHSNKK